MGDMNINIPRLEELFLATTSILLKKRSGFIVTIPRRITGQWWTTVL